MIWLTPIATDIVSTDKLKTVFGTTEDVVVEQLYGSIEDGAARMLFQPRTTHPGDHLSQEAIGDAVEWFRIRFWDGGNGLDPANQTWYWKEIGNLIAAIGMVMLMLPVGMILLKTKFFNELAQAPAPVRPDWLVDHGPDHSALGASSLFTFYYKIPEKQGWAASHSPQNITTTVHTWTTLLGIITILLFLIWHFFFNKKAGGTRKIHHLEWKARLVQDWQILLVRFPGGICRLLSR